jgi:(2Fe-2S) ferredoxin
MSHFARHIFFCLNTREAGQACCHSAAAEAAAAHCKKLVRNAGMPEAGAAKVSRSGCLGRCEYGPVMVVYPEAVWYTYVDVADIEEIFISHVLGGTRVARLELP